MQDSTASIFNRKWLLRGINNEQFTWGDEGQHVLSKKGAHIFGNGNNFVMLKDKKMETIPKNNLGFHAFMKMMIAQVGMDNYPPMAGLVMVGTESSGYFI